MAQLSPLRQLHYALAHYTTPQLNAWQTDWNKYFAPLPGRKRCLVAVWSRCCEKASRASSTVVAAVPPIDASGRWTKAGQAARVYAAGYTSPAPDLESALLPYQPGEAQHGHSYLLPQDHEDKGQGIAIRTRLDRGLSVSWRSGIKAEGMRACDTIRFPRLIYD